MRPAGRTAWFNTLVSPGEVRRTRTQPIRCDGDAWYLWAPGWPKCYFRIIYCMYWISNNELMHTHISGMAAMGQEIWKRWLSITSHSGNCSNHNFANFRLQDIFTRAQTPQVSQDATQRPQRSNGPRRAGLALPLPLPLLASFVILVPAICVSEGEGVRVRSRDDRAFFEVFCFGCDRWLGKIRTSTTIRLHALSQTSVEEVTKRHRCLGRFTKANHLYSTQHIFTIAKQSFSQKYSFT